jgi:uncharacterized protein
VSTEAHKELIVTSLEEAIAGDPSKLLAALHPEVVVREPAYLPYGGEYHGPDGFLELQAKAGEILDVSSLEITDAIGEGDRVVLRMTARFNGAPGEVTLTEHWLVRDGKIVDIEVFWSSLPPR